ncbi:hypothetical protein GCM10025868_38050 [Angustibacter aerolatus]|uniref:Uncharacterized protein n=1 Tax=Angustibacter aerolatus TaxID=1162965 RepID=A0ABQ6JP91_9ACTN|nr:hypothetical protein GCM10025868_38050 [Angustibacter aerolatus]
MTRDSERMVCPYVARTRAYRRKANWVSSSGAMNSGSASSPIGRAASAMRTPVAPIALPSPPSARRLVADDRPQPRALAAEPHAGGEQRVDHQRDADRHQHHQRHRPAVGAEAHGHPHRRVVAQRHLAPQQHEHHQRHEPVRRAVEHHRAGGQQVRQQPGHGRQARGADHHRAC